MGRHDSNSSQRRRSSTACFSSPSSPTTSRTSSSRTSSSRTSSSRTNSSRTNSSRTSSSPPQTDISTSSIATELENALLADIQAINNRSFDPRTSPLYQNKSPFREVLAGGNNQYSRNLQQPSPKQRISLTEWVDWIREMARRYPAYHLRAIEMTTKVDEDEGVAEVFANVENTGMYEGMVVPTVVNVSFRLVDGRWISTGQTSVRGMKWE